MVMKKLIYILSLFVVILAVSCAEDKGNYDYTKVNEIAISGIEGNYSITSGNTIVIKPYFEFMLDSLEDGLEYRWTMAGEEIATTRNLDYAIPEEIGYGIKDCRYEIFDLKSGMKYFQSFQVEVACQFSWGYYFLTKRADNSTELGYFSVMNDNTEFQYATAIGDYEFGDYPQVIKGNAGNVNLNGTTTYCYQFNVITKEGRYPVIKSETATFYPSALITEDKFLNKEEGYKFNPIDKIHHDYLDIDFYVSNGQVIEFVEQMLYRPAIHEGGPYYWTHPIINGASERNIFVFDEISQKYYQTRSEITDYVEGIYGDDNALDKVVEIEDFPSLEGHTIVGVNGTSIGGYEPVADIITNKDGVTHFIRCTATPDFDPYNISARLIYDKTITKDYLNERSVAIGKEFDWYISGTNGIYITPKEGVDEIREFAKIPEEFGYVTCMEFSVYGTKIVVATYNPNSSSERKGSVLFIDASTGKIVDSYKDVIYECVSIMSANIHPAGYGKYE